MPFPGSVQEPRYARALLVPFSLPEAGLSAQGAPGSAFCVPPLMSVSQSHYIAPCPYVQGFFRKKAAAEKFPAAAFFA